MRHFDAGFCLFPSTSPLRGNAHEGARPPIRRLISQASLGSARLPAYTANHYHLRFWLAMQLSALRKGSIATVICVTDVAKPDAVAHRLRELGFVEGESVRVVALAPWGGNPMVVQVGTSRFALRRDEAARVQVQQG
ncbi:FeoA family protein [Pandoraea soli]|nr:FeoA family protein [Pandoraea soli]